MKFENALAAAFADADISVEGSGGKFIATIISDQFAEQTKIARHKMVYGVLNEFIASGEIHALSIVALTTTEHAKDA